MAINYVKRVAGIICQGVEGNFNLFVMLNVIHYDDIIIETGSSDRSNCI